MSPASQLRQPERDASAGNESITTPPVSPHSFTVSSIFAALPGLPCIPIARRPALCLILTLMAGVIVLAAMVCAQVVARQEPPSAVHRQLAAWQRACVLRNKLDKMVEDGQGSALSEAATGLGTTPGAVESDPQAALPLRHDIHDADQWNAEIIIDPDHPILLADLVLAVGEPHWACLYTDLLHNTPAIWLRLIFAQGQIEAYALLPATAGRPAPDTPVFLLSCHPFGADYPVQRLGRWQGFVPLAEYRACPYEGTAIPP